MQKDKRYIFAFDLIRVICMIWVVFIWHLKDYLPDEYHMSGITLSVSSWVTTAALFMFTLLSGYSMAKYSFQQPSDLLEFYKKRFVRFYPLYLTAILCFFTYGWYSWQTVLKCVLGIALFFNEAPFTLWYMCMLMFFYLITPILNWKYRSYKINLAIYIFVVILFGVLSKIDVTHGNMALYTPAYVLGLYLGKKWYIKPSVNSSFITKIVQIVAYSSFCIYLFHRVIFATIANIYNGEMIIGSILLPMDVYCALISIVITPVVAYLLQKLYDFLVLKINFK